LQHQVEHLQELLISLEPEEPKELEENPEEIEGMSNVDND
jgi:hypothetical protein